MLLQISSCVLCTQHISNIKYNLKITCSEKSNIPLIKFVEDLYKNVFLMHCNICNSCYNLLNELDEIRLREKELYSKLECYAAQINTLSLNSNCDMEETNCQNKQKPSIIKDINFNKLSNVTVKRITVKDVYKQSNDTPQSKEQVLEKVQSVIQEELTKHEVQFSSKLKTSNEVLCEMCGQNFKTKMGFENHMKKHYDSKEGFKELLTNKQGRQWSCNICNKFFTQKISLSRHLFLHSGESRYQCEECGKKFVHHTSFSVHKKIHAGERNFKCAVCNRSFLTGSHLKRHTRVAHAKEKKHSCQICGKKFAENYNLMVHSKIHKVGNSTN